MFGLRRRSLGQPAVIGGSSGARTAILHRRASPISLCARSPLDGATAPRQEDHCPAPSAKVRTRKPSLPHTRSRHDSSEHTVPAASSRSLTAEARVRSQAGICGIYGVESGAVTGFSPSTSAFPLLHMRTSFLYHRSHIISENDIVIKCNTVQFEILLMSVTSEVILKLV